MQKEKIEYVDYGKEDQINNMHKEHDSMVVYLKWLIKMFGEQHQGNNLHPQNMCFLALPKICMWSVTSS